MPEQRNSETTPNNRSGQSKVPADGPSPIEQLQRRQALRITLAFFLIWIAVTSSAKAACVNELTPSCLLQLDGFTAVPSFEESISDAAKADSHYVQLYAELANFDRDADADGWRATLAIQQPDGVLVEAAGRATFEILEFSQSRHRHATRRAYVDSRPLARWSVPLNFDAQGMSRVTLPASSTVRRRLGWNGASSIHQGTRVATRSAFGNRINHRWSGRAANDYRRFVTHDLRDRIDYPIRGWLRVRVTMPGQPPLEAIAPIDTRPAFLVDIPTRYR